MFFLRVVSTLCSSPGHVHDDDYVGLQVQHRETGEVMVVKQLLQFDTDAQESFLKEVRKTTHQTAFTASAAVNQQPVRRLIM